MNRSNIALVLVCVTLVSGGCSNEKPASAAQPREVHEGSVPPRPSVVTPPAQAYRAVSVTNGGRITGTVDFDGAFPGDSVIQVAPNQTDCGASVIDHRVVRSGNHVAGVAVWVTDIREGKPLPIERRFELTNEDCVIDPRVQAVVAGGTLDVISADVAPHLNNIINVGTGEREAFAPFNDNGQVVPFDRLLTKPAELEITCDLHPWTRAYVLVLDHPYFAITGNVGDFSIDGVPPGTYHLRAWHPVLGLVDQAITVTSGGTATVAMKLPGEKAAPLTPAAPPESVVSHPKA